MTRDTQVTDALKSCGASIIESCKAETTDTHFCPFALEIDKDESDDYCNCCEQCTENCARNI